MDFIAAVEAESARCVAALRGAELTSPVPSCPGWTAADLAWHLAEVQHFWAAIVDGLLEDPHEAEELTRPDDDEVVALLEDRGAALVAALRAHAPEDRCWSWFDDGWTVGWMARRQAHEALIHRVDAELAAGRPISEPPPALAADGVDEFVTVFMNNLPRWSAFTPDGKRLAVEPDDAPGRWVLEFGRFSGTSPRSGKTYDEDTARPAPPSASADATVTGSAWDLDRWLWGRTDAGVAPDAGSGALPEALTAAGDAGLAARLRAVAVDPTQ